MNVNTDQKRLIALAWVFLGACSAEPSRQTKQPELTLSGAHWTLCPEQRPQMCTQHYDPVCGYSFNPNITTKPDSQSKTYSNSCSACSHVGVVGYETGACQKE